MTTRLVAIVVITLTVAGAPPHWLAWAEESKPTAPKHSTARPQHGDAVKPGSHEDWCGEHGVPESQCTRCNADLTPAFKATGDWCAEHGLPESQCTRCNPDLKITRPPKSVE